MDNHNNTAQGSNRMIAFVLIIIGVLFLCRNLNIFPASVINYIASWPVVLLACSIYCFTRGRVGGGLTLFLIGGFFYLRVTGLLPYGILNFNTIWPIILVLIGVAILTRNRRERSKSYDQPQIASHSVSGSNRQININCSFGTEQQIIVDPVFAGGTIHATIGSVLLDLRHTTLAEGETYLDIYGDFSGVELRVPDNWQIRNEVKTTMGECEIRTKNHYQNIDTDRVLVLRGAITFSGITIK